MLLLVSYAGVLGGAERLLLELAPGADPEVVLACPPGPLAAAARAAGLRTAALRLRPLQLRGGGRVRAAAAAHLIGHAVEVARLARDLDPDLLVAWGIRTALAAAPLRLGCPLAVQVNDLPPAGPLGRALRAAVRRASLVTAPSTTVARGLGPRGARVVAPGVDVAVWGSGGPPEQPFEILVLGALTAVKRPELAVEVLARVRAAVPQARLRFLGAPLPGDGETVLAGVRRRAAELGVGDAVALDGELADVRAALARAAVLLHTGEREAFGRAVLEALAASRPAVVPDAGGVAEIVDATCGVRYPPGDAEAAASGIVGLLTDPGRAAELGVAGRRRATADFGRARARREFHAAWAAVARAPVRTDGSRLAVVTVSHNSAPELAALLRSLDRHLPGAEVVVVDAGSQDESVAVARARPGTVVRELANVGFGAACNAGVRAVTAPVTALLNPDVELLDGSLAALAARAAGAAGRARVGSAEHPGPGGPSRLLAPLLLGSALTRQDSAHPAPLSAAALAFALVPPSALPERLAARLAPWRSRAPRPVGWATGAALVGRTDLLRRLGPFDERIFLLGEDLELGLRARRAGVPTWFCPQARVVHHGDHAIGPAHGGEDLAHRARARRAAVARAYGTAGAIADGALQALTFTDRLALKRLAGRDGARERAQLAAVVRVTLPGRRSRPGP